jgi:hypothetical protein
MWWAMYWVSGSRRANRQRSRQCSTWNNWRTSREDGRTQILIFRRESEQEYAMFHVEHSGYPCIKSEALPIKNRTFGGVQARGLNLECCFGEIHI